MTEQKRARNRLSQRYFRERRKLRLKELETQVQSLSATDSDRNARLATENAKLRNSLVQTRKRMAQLKSMITSLDETLEGLLDASYLTTTGMHDATQKVATSKEQDPTAVPTLPDAVTPAVSPSCVQHQVPEDQSADQIRDAYQHTPPLDHFNTSGRSLVERFESAAAAELENDSPAAVNSTNQHNNISYPLDIDTMLLSVVPDGSNPATLTGMPWNSPLSQNWPDVFEYHSMFPSRHQPQHSNPCVSWSQDLNQLELGIKSHLQQRGEDGTSKEFLYQSCTALILLFSRNVWPGPQSLWFSSYCYKMILSVLSWRLNPTPQTFKGLPPYHVPTELQSQTPHSSIIDWVTIAPLRDRLIELYNFSPELDTIFIDLMNYAVVQVEDLSAIFTGVEKRRGFIGVWNIFNTVQGAFRKAAQPHAAVLGIKSIPEFSDSVELGLLQAHKLALPAVDKTCTATGDLIGDWQPISPTELFCSAAMSQKIYYQLELYRSDKCWRLDPTFFDKYPELRWDGYLDVVASGTRFRVDAQGSHGYGNQPCRLTLSDYQQVFLSVQAAW
ncbi:hypothetical protein BDV12DRAFT_178639 [Aspergillus spectabilis]